MLTSPTFMTFMKLTFIFAIVSNIAITTLKFVNKMGAKLKGNGVLEFKKATQSIFRLENIFYIALW